MSRLKTATRFVPYLSLLSADAVMIAALALGFGFCLHHSDYTVTTQ